MTSGLNVLQKMSTFDVVSRLKGMETLGMPHRLIIGHHLCSVFPFEGNGNTLSPSFVISFRIACALRSRMKGMETIAHMGQYTAPIFLSFDVVSRLKGMETYSYRKYLPRPNCLVLRFPV